MIRPPRTDAASRIGHHGATPASARLAVSKVKVEPTYHQLARRETSMNGRVALWSSLPLLIETFPGPLFLASISWQSSCPF